MLFQQMHKTVCVCVFAHKHTCVIQQEELNWLQEIKAVIESLSNTQQYVQEVVIKKPVHQRQEPHPPPPWQPVS